MASRELTASLKVAIETAQAEGNLKSFWSTFRKTLEDMGKTRAEIKALEEIAAQLAKGELALESVDKETQDLITTYKELRAVVGARQTLNFVPEAEIKRKVAAVREAYETLRRSGTLTRRELAAASAAADREIAKIEGRLNSTGRAAQGFTERIKGMAGGFAAMAASVLSIQGLKNIFTSIIRSGDGLELLQKQLDGIMGSAKGGAEAMQWLKDNADTLGGSLEVNAQVFLKLKKFGIDPMSGAMQALVDTNARAGGSMQDLDNMAQALGKAWGKMRMSAEEVNPLVERGVAVYSLLANAMGRTEAEIQRMVSTGELGRREIAMLMDEMGKANAGAAAAQMDLVSSAIVSLRDQITQTQKSIFDAGLGDLVKQQLTEIRLRFTEAAQAGSAGAWAKGLSSAFETALVAVINVGNIIRITANGVTSGLAAMGLGVMTVVEGLTRAAGRAAEALGRTKAAEKWKAEADALAAINADLKEQILQDGEDIRIALADIASGEGFAKVATEAQAAGAAVDGLAGKSEAAGKSIVENLGQGGDALKQGFQAATKSIGLDLDQIRTGVSKTAALGIADFKAFAAGVKTEFSDVKDQAKAIEAAYREALKNIGSKEEAEALKTALRSAFDDGIIGAQLYSELLAETEARLKGTAAAARDAGRAVSEAGKHFKQAADDTAGVGTALADSSGRIADDAEIIGDAGARMVQMTRAAHAAAQSNLQASMQALSDHQRRVRELLDDYSAGEVSAKTLIRRAEFMIASFKQLDQSDLSSLKSAIESARSSMDALHTSSKATVESLRDELDKLQGNTQALMQREYQRRLTDLQSQLKEARASGSRESVQNLEEAISLASQVFNEQLRAAKAEENRKRQEAFQQRQAAQGDTGAFTPGSQPARETLHGLRLTGPHGDEAVIQADSKSLATVIAILEQAGMTTPRTGI